MARTPAAFRCSECGWTTAKWVGRCGECQAWGTVDEVGAPRTRTTAMSTVTTPAVPIGQVDVEAARAVSSGLSELDRVLGGGFVPGAVMLLAGEPGVGKSTLLLETAASWGRGGRRALYITGEESAAQVRLRAERIGAVTDELYLAAETDLGRVLGHIDAINPSLLVLDSVQTVASSEVDGAAGGVTQVREVAAALVAAAKARDLATVLVGHVTKDGSVAGPRTLEHLVDVVLTFEGDRQGPLRLVRAVKNRYGPADEIGCFELVDDGIVGLADPSGLFLGDRREIAPGTCVTVTIEGRRPLVAEVQALVAPSSAPQPRRVTSGLDSARIAMMLGVLERRAGVRLGHRGLLRGHRRRRSPDRAGHRPGHGARARQQRLRRRAARRAGGLRRGGPGRRRPADRLPRAPSLRGGPARLHRRDRTGACPACPRHHGDTARHAPARGVLAARGDRHRTATVPLRPQLDARGNRMSTDIASEARIREVLAMVAPGTALRDGLERILRGRTGALIVVGWERSVEQVANGGFVLDVGFSATRLRELSKMDGAIVLDNEARNILRAAVQLVPDPTLPTEETGTRHRTADRVSRQTHRPVISVSKSMNIIAIYVDGRRHVLEDTAGILSRGNQGLSTLEKYKARLDEVSATLSGLEIENLATVRDVALVAQRAQMVRIIRREVENYVVELGTEGRLLALQLHELVAGVEAERTLLVRDYLVPAANRKKRGVEKALGDLDGLSETDLLELTRVAQAFGFPDAPEALEIPVSPRGFRLMARVPRLPEVITDRIVGHFGSLPKLLAASTEDLQKVEGVGETRARSVRDAVSRLAEATLLERLV